MTPTPEGDERKERWPWFNAQYRETWTSNGRYHFGGDSPLDLVGYLGPIEPQPESQPESDTEPQQVNDWPSVRDLRRELKAVQDKNAKLQTQADELRSEVSLRSAGVLGMFELVPPETSGCVAENSGLPSPPG